jgi:hypothetical protein
MQTLLNRHSTKDRRGEEEDAGRRRSRDRRARKKKEQKGNFIEETIEA